MHRLSWLPEARLDGAAPSDLCPVPGGVLASGGGDGSAVLAEGRSCRPFARLLHPQAVFGVHWADADVVRRAVTSGRWCAKHNVTVSMLATGCADGRVRVWALADKDMARYAAVSASTDGSKRDAHSVGAAAELEHSSQPFAVLRGHGQRVFNVAWSPLLPGVLASGSDDCTV